MWPIEARRFKPFKNGLSSLAESDTAGINVKRNLRTRFHVDSGKYRCFKKGGQVESRFWIKTLLVRLLQELHELR